jgi:hypothetical protein
VGFIFSLIYEGLANASGTFIFKGELGSCESNDLGEVTYE